jgi:hypothetical protein
VRDVVISNYKIFSSLIEGKLNFFNNKGIQYEVIETETLTTELHRQSFQTIFRSTSIHRETKWFPNSKTNKTGGVSSFPHLSSDDSKIRK